MRSHGGTDGIANCAADYAANRQPHNQPNSKPHRKPTHSTHCCVAWFTLFMCALCQLVTARHGESALHAKSLWGRSVVIDAVFVTLAFVALR